MEFKQALLPNGLRVIAEVNPEAKSMAIGYFVKTGARDEQPQEAGLSHFLEHMVFKGTAKRDGFDVNREFDEMGAQYNAMTSEEYTVYYGAVLPEFGPRLLELWTDLMRPGLQESDFETEKKVILEEIALYADRPQFMLFDWARQRYFGQHPLGNSVLGTTESVSALSLEQMQSYHSRRYVPSNVILALAGQLDWDAMLQQAQQLTAHWLPGQAQRTLTPHHPTPGNERVSYAQATQVYLTLLAPGLAAQDPQRYAASVLASILGEDGNSRLHWSLVDKGLVESASAGHDDADGLGSYYVYVQTDSANEAAVISILNNELERLEREGVSTDEVRRAKNKLATSIVFAGETPMNRLFNLGMGYQYTGEYQPLSETARKVEAVTLEQVNQLLQSKPFSQGFLYRLVPEE